MCETESRGAYTQLLGSSAVTQRCKNEKEFRFVASLEWMSQYGLFIAASQDMEPAAARSIFAAKKLSCLKECRWSAKDAPDRVELGVGVLLTPPVPASTLRVVF